VTIGGILITTPRVLEFEDRVVHAEEQGHHDAALQKLHDYVWGLIEYYGEEPIRRRIAEIDAAELEGNVRGKLTAVSDVGTRTGVITGTTTIDWAVQAGRVVSADTRLVWTLDSGERVVLDTRVRPA
jgi:hypothetical protein